MSKGINLKMSAAVMLYYLEKSTTTNPPNLSLTSAPND